MQKRNWIFIDVTAESIIVAGMIKNNIVLPVISCPDNIIAGAKSNALNLSGPVEIVSTAATEKRGKDISERGECWIFPRYHISVVGS